MYMGIMSKDYDKDVNGKAVSIHKGHSVTIDEDEYDKGSDTCMVECKTGCMAVINRKDIQILGGIF